jgi:hypothetical protein
MKKLLLTLASLALLSTSLYAGCTADVDMDGNRIMKLGAPTTGTDAVNRDYVDTRILMEKTGSPITLDTDETTWQSYTIPHRSTCIIQSNRTHIRGVWINMGSTTDNITVLGSGGMMRKSESTDVGDHLTHIKRVNWETFAFNQSDNVPNVKIQLWCTKPF